jgi:hypothetical protein
MYIMEAAIKHYMNPLHIYCRLRDIGIGKGTAMFLCRIYERNLFRYFICKQTPDS